MTPVRLGPALLFAGPFFARLFGALTFAEAAGFLAAAFGTFAFLARAGRELFLFAFLEAGFLEVARAAMDQT